MSGSEVLTVQTSNYASDGYQYGVMFNDGSVTAKWRGDNQREQATRYLITILGAQVLRHRRFDYLSVCRRRKDGEWERMRL